jgi:energy-coupling factor transporter ATP-binding protein EcfA2
MAKSQSTPTPDGTTATQSVLAHTVTTGELVELIASHTADDWTPDAPGLLIIGPPGCGKTAATRQAADLLARRSGTPVGIKDVRLTEVTPIDLIGLPYHDPGRGRTSWAPSDLLPGPDDPPKGLIVFDELPNAAPSVQSAVYKACTEHMIGPHPLPPGWWVILAGNRASDRGNTFPIPKPLVNRVTVLEVAPSLDDWLAYMLPRNLSPEIHAYLKQNPHHLLGIDYSPDPIPFPTPRAWTYLSWHIARLRSADLPEADFHRRLSLLAQGQVGPAVGTQFATYIRLFDKIPDAQAIMTGKAKPPAPTEMDAAWALVSALVAWVPRVRTLRHFVEYLDRLPKDLQIYAVRAAVLTSADRQQVVQRFQAPDTKPAWDRWCSENKEYIGAIAAHAKRGAS